MTDVAHTAGEQELVNLPVPKALLPDVTALLHRYYSGQLDERDAASPLADDDRTGADAAVEVPGNGMWSERDIARLHDSFRNVVGREVITFIARRSIESRSATYGELMAHSGLDEYKLRSQFSWFSKKSKAMKGLKAWPLQVTDAGSNAKKGERFSYRMPPEIARWWLQVHTP